MPDDPRQALGALVARIAAVPRSARAGVVQQLLPLLADARLPPPVRVAAAARVLKFVPDRAVPVRRVTRALTVGLSPSRALDRLRQLQNQIEKCAALDAIIDRREKRVKLACPRCRVRLPRVEMIKHLWHEHGLTLDRGKTRTPERVVEELREAHAATGDPGPLDRVVALGGTAGLRKWLAGEEPPAEEVAPLLTAADERGAGLCPACFAELPTAVTPLPEPLTLANGRLAGDGYAVEVGGNAWFRTLRVTTPEKPTSTGRRSLAPRAAATLAAGLALVVVLLFARSQTVAAAGIAVAVLVYAVTRYLRSPAVGRGDRAVNAAWARLAPKLAERPYAARFLTRLCLASTGRGDPDGRVGVLNMIAARAAGRADESDAELQLLAAARVLQVEDVARFGRDVVAGIAALAADGFTGALPADYAEYVVGCYLTRERDPGDLARLRVLLIGAAFDAGLVPRDLLDLWAGAPNLRQAIAVEPGHRLGLLFGVWRTRAAKAWQAVGPADTVFDLARTSPPTAARVLAKFPDLLLFHRPEQAVEDLVGPVLVCARGVAVGGQLTTDPDADVRLERGGRELIFGRHRIDLPRRLPAEFPELVQKWLQFRAEGLLPFIDGYLSPGSAEASRRVLGPFCRRCLACGTVSAVASGAVGRPVPA
jgi:predicted RNA-binding Zn-ribbon protein involved in translation (DUF1610 family)